MKRIFVFAGPNGAGKTTFAAEFLARQPDPPDFLNADTIAAKLCPRDPASVAVRAGRLMLEQMDAHLEAGRSFAIETTLSGRAYARQIPVWRATGFEVTLIFLTLPSPELSVIRVAERVRQGGHDIPEETIRRRFDTGLNHFYTLYRDLVDHWFLYDNSGRSANLLESGKIEH